MPRLHYYDKLGPVLYGFVRDTPEPPRQMVEFPMVRES